ALKLMEVMLARGKKMSELAAPVVFYPQVLKNVRVKSKPEAQNDPDVQAAVAAVAEALGDEGRILVRESGTEPVIRVMVEAGSDEVCEKYVDQVIDVITAKGHPRRNQLLDFIRRERIQTLVAATEEAYFPQESIGTCYDVREGTVSKR
ncbi:MAG: hypothetical protein IIZ54_05550, partial [Selenomonadaceae bacterium]|nr:hypothetical protein [Selenomonadaceae bacterium]